ncbi:1-phosphofructokinase family hexose kinase [Microbacterium schleiferi]|uniref:PfkB family carbohydrate kinase n=1 Tax=Microbacterium schleiferi TaxID=69362 RepID=A0ABU7V6V2_9MICO
MNSATVFAPSPTLTVTIESHPSGDDVHLHAGGQGVWQARMLTLLGVDVTLCALLSGESGLVIRTLLEREGITIDAIERGDRGSAYIHDRRDGERRTIAEQRATTPGRHEMDELYSLTLSRGIDTGLVVLSGPPHDEIPVEIYHRLASDLRRGGARVVVDLAGERLDAALRGGVSILKLSDEELAADESGGSTADLTERMSELRSRGAETVILTRASQPALLLDAEGLAEIAVPRFEIADHRGAGDSLTAGVVAGIARGQTVREAVTLGAAAGALNVTRHGLGTGHRDAIEGLRDQVSVRVVESAATPADGRVTPDDLAAMTTPEQTGRGREAL